MDKKHKFTVYLAGYSKYSEYRKIVKEKYSEYINLIDPVDYKLEDVYKDIGNELSDTYIVRKDKKSIEQCDILVAKIEYPQHKEISIGTIMECMYAFMKGIPVFIISSDEDILNDIWLKFHSKNRFKTIEHCFAFILNRLGIEN